MNSSNCDHLSQDLIFRTLDDELTSAERSECELHLAVCDACRHQLQTLREFSLEIESAVHATVLPDMSSVRANLQKTIENQRAAAPMILQHPGKVMRRFGWGVAIAATLALGVLLAPSHEFTPQASQNAPVAQAATTAPQSTAIEVDGETFMPVPYSNADLPISTPHIVQMQVPVSSLVDVGIVLEPVTSRVGAGSDGTGAEGDRSVLADVLIGSDGQPRGVHVVGFE